MVIEPEPVYHCPQCGYDLRGQTVERCPECGLFYDKAALRDLGMEAYRECFSLYMAAVPMLVAATGLAICFQFQTDQLHVSSMRLWLIVLIPAIVAAVQSLRVWITSCDRTYAIESSVEATRKVVADLAQSHPAWRVPGSTTWLAVVVAFAAIIGEVFPNGPPWICGAFTAAGGYWSLVAWGRKERLEAKSQDRVIPLECTRSLERAARMSLMLTGLCLVLWLLLL